MSEAMKTAEQRLHLYYGEGKGKTTAAMGLALRALGHGRKVLIAQFMKTGTSGELAALRQVPGARVEVLSPVRGFFSRMSEGEQARTIREQTRQARDLADEINREQPDMIVLDELAVAWARGAVEDAAAEALVRAALAAGETVVTGRDAPAWLLARADYVSQIASQRHPYQTEGLRAREGVEW